MRGGVSLSSLTESILGPPVGGQTHIIHILFQGFLLHHFVSYGMSNVVSIAASKTSYFQFVVEETFTQTT